ncbi:MAG: hypothetical protein OEY38_10560 [Gammaproteobacteria bacterium]|nr:hypothetical protein [Gammaproteobacteria bacterium]
MFKDSRYREREYFKKYLDLCSLSNRDLIDHIDPYYINNEKFPGTLVYVLALLDSIAERESLAEIHETMLGGLNKQGSLLQYRPLRKYNRSDITSIVKLIHNWIPYFSLEKTETITNCHEFDQFILQCTDSAEIWRHINDEAKKDANNTRRIEHFAHYLSAVRFLQEYYKNGGIDSDGKVIKKLNGRDIIKGSPTDYLEQNGNIGLYPRVCLLVDCCLVNDVTNDTVIQEIYKELAPLFCSNHRSLRESLRRARGHKKITLDQVVSFLVPYIKERYSHFDEQFFTQPETSVLKLAAVLFSYKFDNMCTIKGDIDSLDLVNPEIYIFGDKETARYDFSNSYLNFLNLSNAPSSSHIRQVIGTHTSGINAFIAHMINTLDPTGTSTVYMKCDVNEIDLPIVTRSFTELLASCLGLEPNTQDHLSRSKIFEIAGKVTARYIFHGLSNATPELIDFVAAFCRHISTRSRVLIIGQSIVQLSHAGTNDLCPEHFDYPFDFDATFDDHIEKSLNNDAYFICNEGSRELLFDKASHLTLAQRSALGDNYRNYGDACAYLLSCVFTDYSESIRVFGNTLDQCITEMSEEPLVNLIIEILPRKTATQLSVNILYVLSLSDGGLKESTLLKILRNYQKMNEGDPVSLTDIQTAISEGIAGKLVRLKKVRVGNVPKKKVVIDSNFAKKVVKYLKKHDSQRYKDLLCSLIVVMEEKKQQAIVENNTINWERFFRFTLLARLNLLAFEYSESETFTDPMRSTLSTLFERYSRSEGKLSPIMRVKILERFYDIASIFRNEKPLIFIQISIFYGRNLERRHQLEMCINIINKACDFYNSIANKGILPKNVPEVAWVIDLFKLRIDWCARKYSARETVSLCDRYLEAIYPHNSYNRVKHGQARLLGRKAHLLFINDDIEAAMAIYKNIDELNSELCHWRSYNNEYVLQGNVTRWLFRFHLYRATINHRLAADAKSAALEQLENNWLTNSGKKSTQLLLDRGLFAYFIEKQHDKALKDLREAELNLDNDLENPLYQIDYYHIATVLYTFEATRAKRDRRNADKLERRAKSSARTLKEQCTRFSYDSYLEDIELYLQPIADLPNLLLKAKKSNQYIPTFLRMYIKVFGISFQTEEEPVDS